MEQARTVRQLAIEAKASQLAWQSPDKRYGRSGDKAEALRYETSQDKADDNGQGRLVFLARAVL